VGAIYKNKALNIKYMLKHHLICKSLPDLLKIQLSHQPFDPNKLPSACEHLQQ
jgi:hypothetical protein